MLESPTTAIIPSKDKTQIKINTTAICLNGLGKAPTNQIRTRKMRTLQRVIVSPLKLNKTIWRIAKGA
jgi:hypothetical protein